jgi:hypothetical protein
VASTVGDKGEQTFYAFGIDVSDHQRAQRDVAMLLSRATGQPHTA